MKLQKIFLFFSSTLIVIFPFLLIKPATADIACVLIGLFYLFYCLYKKDFSYFKNNFFYFFLIIFIYININSFFSFKPLISYDVSLSYLRIIIFIVSLSFFFKERSNLKLYFYYSFFICVLILFLDSFYQLFLGKNILGYLLNDNRVSSFFGEKLIMGSYVVRLLPLFLGIGFLLNLKKLNFFLLLISSTLVILSAERVAFAYFLICAFFYFYFSFDIKRSLYLLLIFLILFFSLLIIFPKNFNRLIYHTYQQSKQNNSILGLSYRHQLHFITAYNMFSDKKIFGHGLKTFRYLCDDPKYSVQQKIINDYTIVSPGEGRIIYDFDNLIAKVLNSQNEIILEKTFVNLTKFLVTNGELVSKNQKLFYTYEFNDGCNTHPHNIYLQFLSELGIIGFFLFLIIFIYSLYNLIIIIKKSFTKKLNNKDQCTALVLLCIATSMFPVFPSGNYFNNWLLIISYLPIGFYLSLLKKKNND